MMAVGDIDSKKRGSGARANAGKAPLDLIPVNFYRMRWTNAVQDGNPRVSGGSRLVAGIEALDMFQSGYDEAVEEFLLGLPHDDWVTAARVFEYGAQKYAAWNWAKGMPWKVPLGCALRHAVSIVEGGELIDAESGHGHWGHFLCNLFMLAHFVHEYPEGDDRPIFEEETDNE